MVWDCCVTQCCGRKLQLSLSAEVPSSRDLEPVLPSTSAGWLPGIGWGSSRDLELSLVFTLDEKPFDRFPLLHILLVPQGLLESENMALSSKGGTASLRALLNGRMWTGKDGEVTAKARREA